jgi:hypothetical protein
VSITWFERHPGNQNKVAGRLMIGRDCDCAAVQACQQCGTALTGRRAQARFCSDRCRQAACRARALTETVTGESAANDRNRDMSR